ncbi:hypothetical protein [Polluticaenibacter yanchengensis]|uniref:VWA domain-containing protein n=1 Tax=Polluticaenibacter yanchengensis TaxID=3014562 RepID=A0ABT4UG69_9BACT|nr:hypothetical protein [Chitinophagaceae bacterium LY-5]
MEQQYKKQKIKDKKPIYILSGLIVFFGIFIYFITKPSLLNTAIDKIQISNNINDVKILFERYKFDLLETDELGNKIVSPEFQNAARNKIQSFNPGEDEIADCIKWLPPAKSHINIIVIPDLSKRIVDHENNPDQVKNDSLVLNTIWQSFVEYSKFRQDTKDRLIVDVTDKYQANGQFSKIANNLQFDLSSHKGKSNRLYFTKDKDLQYTQAIDSLYKYGISKTSGADYPHYFERYLIHHLKKPTLFENYINKVIIITDGYLEIGGNKIYTNLIPELKKSPSISYTKKLIDKLELNIPTGIIDLSNTDILICEVNERKSGKKVDLEILYAYWENWFEKMNARKKLIIQREQATDLTKDKIKAFLKN